MRQTKATGRPDTLGDSDGLSLAISGQSRNPGTFRYYGLAYAKLQFYAGHFSKDDVPVLSGSWLRGSLYFVDYQSEPQTSEIISRYATKNGALRE